MTARIGSFNAASAARISRVVQAVERAGGGGVIRRGKFDDAGAELARSFDIGFETAGTAWNLTVGPGNAFYWFHNEGAGSAFGYKRVATYDQSKNPDVFFTSSDKYYVVYATASRTIGTPDVYALTIAIQIGTSEANAIDSINTTGGGWYGTVYSVIIPLAVVYNGRIVRRMHDGDIYFRDDPAPGAITVSISGVWPGWKLLEAVGGNNVDDRYLLLSYGSYSSVGGNATHMHNGGGSHPHGLTQEYIEVQSGTGATVSGNGTTVNAADIGQTAEANTDPPYMKAVVIEKL
jgi:hypothetical protein